VSPCSNMKPLAKHTKAARIANAVHGQLGSSLYYCDRHAFVGRYRQAVLPQLEFAVQAWCPRLTKDVKTLEKVQKIAGKSSLARRSL
jgi:hypothetical protein